MAFIQAFIINKNNTVTWICDELSRKGKKGCRGVRIPDEKLSALRDVDYAVYIGKETIDGVPIFGYQRTRNTEASTQPENYNRLTMEANLHGTKSYSHSGKQDKE